MKRLVAVVLLAALVSACSKVSSPGESGSEHSWTKPGVLRIAIQAEPKSLNSVLESNTTESFVDRLIFDPLLSADAKGEPVPVLATVVPTLENGGISKDGLTITYHLHDGVNFSDGSPLTSKDVKFTWQTMMNPANDVATHHGYDDVASIDTPNPTTVIVHLKARFAPFVNTFFAESDTPIEIVPAHVLSHFPNVNQIPFNNEPVGSGAFRLAEWVKGDHIRLVANPNYFRGTPGLKEIDIRVVPDENTTLNLMRTHDIDWMFEPSYATYSTLKNMPDVIDHFNNVNGYEGMTFNTSRAPLDDVQVRRALTYAIDKKLLLDTLTFGQQKIATEDLPDWMWAYNPHVTVYPHDLVKTRALLAADGWHPGSDGVLEKNGQRFSLLLVTNVANTTRRKASVLVQSMLKQVGIEAQIKYFDAAQLFAADPSIGILSGGKFDIALYGWFSGLDPDDSALFSCVNRPPGGFNYSRYCTPEMEQAQHLALTSNDRPARTAAYARVEEALATDSPQIFFWWDRQAQAISPDFKGFDPNPVTESWNAYQWSI